MERTLTNDITAQKKTTTKKQQQQKKKQKKKQQQQKTTTSWRIATSLEPFKLNGKENGFQ